jgi:CDGSH-type Zn-finger protein/uncharacterized Fe-S cluster protein YjdI
MAQSKVHRYASTAAVVTWDAKRCIHAAECVHTLPEVFDPDAKPWIRPSAADAAAIRTAVDRCPSGALAMHAPDGSNVALQPATNTGLLMSGGPLYLRGKLQLQLGDVVQDETRMALCRCGASQNKPFCDNSHQKVGFKDPGALAATSAPEPGTDLGAALTITPTTNGPVKCDGPLTLHGNGGRTAFSMQTFLCRCGGSRNKPYCDGTHRTIGFAG